jgi:hypothetical protein
VGGDGQPVPASEFSGANGRNSGGIYTSGYPGVRLVVLKRVWLAHVRILRLHVSVKFLRAS